MSGVPVTRPHQPARLTASLGPALSAQLSPRSAAAVLATITSKSDKTLVQVTIDADAPARFRATGNEPEHPIAKVAETKLSESGVLIATDNHPFWVAGDINAWVSAADLEPGMWLRTSAGTYTQITAVKAWTTHHQRVHNFTVANHHTYYVQIGTMGVLVHNAGGCGNFSSPRNAFKHWKEAQERVP